MVIRQNILIMYTLDSTTFAFTYSKFYKLLVVLRFLKLRLIKHSLPMFSKSRVILIDIVNDVDSL